MNGLLAFCIALVAFCAGMIVAGYPRDRKIANLQIVIDYYHRHCPSCKKAGAPHA